MKNENENMLYLLAGFGLGAIMGAAAGILFAPQKGEDLRGDINDKLGDIKDKTTDKLGELKDKTTGWVNEKKAKAQNAVEAATDELGA